MYAVCEQDDGFNCGVYLCRYLYAFIRTTATEQFQDFTYSQVKNWNQGHIHQFENKFFQFDRRHVIDLRLKFTVMTVNLVRWKMEWQPKESRKTSLKRPMQVRKSEDELKGGKSPMQKCTQQAPLCKKIALDIDHLEEESINDSDNEPFDLAVQEGQEDIAGMDPPKENDIEHESGIDGNSEKDSPSKVSLLANDADKKNDSDIPVNVSHTGDVSPKESSQNESDDQDDEQTSQEEIFFDRDKYRKSKFFVISFSSPYLVGVNFSAGQI